MTRDDINRLIQDNGLFHGTVKIGVIMDINHLERFAALVAAAERERLAQPQRTHWEGCEEVHPECRKQEQEPVAWAVYDILHGGSKTLHWPEQHSPNGDPKQYKAVPLFTAPTPRKPLTDDQIVDIWAGVSMDYDDEINIIELGRAIERAHGIGEQHE